MTTVNPTSVRNQPSDPSLYFELRGDGQPVLLVPGTPGDGGQFDELADILAAEHLVLTYDRAGASRSSGARSVSVNDHADDAAALLRSHVKTPATVYGTSNGALIALELALRHPSLVGRVVLHEAPLLSVLDDPAPIGEMLGGIIGAAMEEGGPCAALDAFLRFAYGAAVVDMWSRDLRDRMLENAEMVFSVEMPAFQTYRPDEAALQASRVPAMVAVGAEQAAPFFLESASWLAARLGTKVVPTPGAHGPQFTCPRELASAVFAGRPAVG